MESYALSDEEMKSCRKCLVQLVSESNAIVASVLSSPDGLLLASATDGVELEVDSVAAMSSSLIALADAMAGQAGQAMSDKVISDAKDSSFVILHAGALILTVIGKANVNMGMVFASSQQVASKIAAQVEAAAEETQDQSGVFRFDSDALLARVMQEVEEKRNK